MQLHGSSVPAWYAQEAVSEGGAVELRPLLPLLLFLATICMPHLGLTLFLRHLLLSVLLSRYPLSYTPSFRETASLRHP